MAEKAPENKVTHAVYAGGTPKSKQLVGQGTKAEMDKIANDLERAAKSNKAGLYIEVVKL